MEKKDGNQTTDYYYFFEKFGLAPSEIEEIIIKLKAQGGDHGPKKFINGSLVVAEKKNPSHLVNVREAFLDGLFSRDSWTNKYMKEFLTYNWDLKDLAGDYSWYQKISNGDKKLQRCPVIKELRSGNYIYWEGDDQKIPSGRKIYDYFLDKGFKSLEKGSYQNMRDDQGQIDRGGEGFLVPIIPYEISVIPLEVETQLTTRELTESDGTTKRKEKFFTEYRRCDVQNSGWEGNLITCLFNRNTPFDRGYAFYLQKA